MLETEETPINPTIPDQDGALSWRAHEFVGHQKSAGWYGRLALVFIVAAGLTYLLTRDMISTSVIIIAGILLGVYGARQPKMINYQLSDKGLMIGRAYHGMDEFRSFALSSEAGHPKVVLVPLKRFGQLVTMYYYPQDEDQIVDLLSGVLPFTEHQHDPLDRLLNRIRF